MKEGILGKTGIIEIILLLLLLPRLVFAYTFAWLSDVHIEIGKERIVDQEMRFSLSTTILENAVRDINENKDIDFVIITGDILNNGRSWNLDASKFILDKLNKPYFVVIGNNDFAMPISGIGISKTTFHTAFADNEPNFKGGIWSYSPVKDLLLIGIDNINPISGGEAWTENLMKNLEKHLKSNNRKDVIILVHYPIVELNYQKNGKLLYSAMEFMDLCKRYKVSFICSGHYHYKEFQKIDSIFNFICPALIEFPHQYLTVLVSSKEVNISSHNVLDIITIEESRNKLAGKIRKLLYSYPDISEQQILDKMIGKKVYNYAR
ncbi:MAG: hypothetical protein DRH57_01060 [Candidatus Cloacimonadota bacterium]|nr:MAG: hypothetical protein DRH57_01060 [Candidatus Cloacimonadota bacterium]